MESHTSCNAIILKEHLKHQVFQNVQVSCLATESIIGSCFAQAFQEPSPPEIKICLATEQVEVAILAVRWKFFFILASKEDRFDIFPVFLFWKWKNFGEEALALFHLSDAIFEASFIQTAFDFNVDESLFLKGDNQEIKLSTFSLFCPIDPPAIDHNSILSVASF
jgi:hypothetical protein